MMFTAPVERVTAKVGCLWSFNHLDTLNITEGQEAATGTDVGAIPEQRANLCRRRNDLLVHAAEANGWVYAPTCCRGAFKLKACDIVAESSSGLSTPARSSWSCENADTETGIS